MHIAEYTDLAIHATRPKTSKLATVPPISASAFSWSERVTTDSIVRCWALQLPVLHAVGRYCWCGTTAGNMIWIKTVYWHWPFCYSLPTRLCHFHNEAGVIWKLFWTVYTLSELHCEISEGNESSTPSQGAAHSFKSRTLLIETFRNLDWNLKIFTKNWNLKSENPL